MTSDARREPFKEGDEFLQYRIHSLFGRGGHAFVYSGQHRYMERPVAIKVIPAPAEMNSDVYKRARLEAKILSQLEHPNVVKVYDAGVTDDGIIYIVMEMLEGRTLRASLKHMGAFAILETLHVGIQIAEAVQVAHAQRAIHRDLKPENVFVLPGNTIKVLDFGITKFLGASTMTTQPNFIRGTPQYMSPEHMEGRPVTAQSDVFALGSVLYELLVAVPPALIGLQEVSNFTIGYSQIHRVPPRLDEVSSSIPRYVARVIQRMLAKVPSERQTSMNQVAEELRSLRKRFMDESPQLSIPLRELWHGTNGDSRAPSTHGVHSVTTAVGKVVLTGQVTAAVDGLGSNLPCATVPLESATPTVVGANSPAAPIEPARIASAAHAISVPNKADPALSGPKEIVARAEHVIAQRLAAKQSTSGPMPVTLQHRRSHSRAHSLTFLVLSVVCGATVGLGAVVAYKRGFATHTTSTSPSIALAAAELPPPTVVVAPQPSANVSAVSTALAVPQAPQSAEAKSNPVSDTAINHGTVPARRAAVDTTKLTAAPISQSVAEQASHKTLWMTQATESDSSSPVAPETNSQRRTSPKPAASSARSNKASKSKDQLIFGADDLNW